jgi:hypothetical protein
VLQQTVASYHVCVCGKVQGQGYRGEGLAIGLVIACVMIVCPYLIDSRRGKAGHSEDTRKD